MPSPDSTSKSSHPLCRLDTVYSDRLEMLGDAVLKLSTSVYVFATFPARHEGQLSVMRQHSVANNYLLARGREIGLQRFLTVEVGSRRRWKLSVLPGASKRSVKRAMPRRSLQDCMEALLGAA